jgi:hypothetical protein
MAPRLIPIKRRRFSKFKFQVIFLRLHFPIGINDLTIGSEGRIQIHALSGGFCN